MSNTYEKMTRHPQPGPLPGEATVPEQVIVSNARDRGSAKEGLLALAVGTGLQVMAAMFEQEVARRNPRCRADHKYAALSVTPTARSCLPGSSTGQDRS